MKSLLLVLLAVSIATVVTVKSVVTAITEDYVPIMAEVPRKDHRIELVREYLQSKNSPLADESELLLKQKHWEFLIAISAIESEFCQRQLSWNCWGIGGDMYYRHYSSLRAAIIDADDFITHWQSKGRWLTVEDMNCSYVQPCNENWVRVVKKVLADLEIIMLKNIGQERKK